MGGTGGFVDSDHSGGSRDVRGPDVAPTVGGQSGVGVDVPGVDALGHIPYVGADEFGRPLHWGACEVCGRILWTHAGPKPSGLKRCPGPPGIALRGGGR
jgi:hypothetical protein